MRTTLVILMLCAGGLARAADVVARVGDQDVTAEELRAHVATLPAEEQAALARDPALLAQVVRLHLGRLAVLGEARARRWDQEPAARRQLDRVRDDALVELYLQSVSRPPDSYPGEEELRKAYEANRTAFAAPASYRVAQVFVASPKGAPAEADQKARARVDALSKQLRQKGADFAAVARAESDEKGAAARGGEIGWLAEGQLVPGIRPSVLALAKGAVSEPIRLDDGWHLVKLLDARPAGVRPFDEVKGALAAELRAQRARALRQAYLAKLLGEKPPALNELALSKVLPTPAGQR